MGILNSDTGNLVYIVPQSSYYFATAGQGQNFEETEEDIFLNDLDQTVKQQQDARLILSATTHFEKIETAVATNYPVSSSGSQGDNYRPNGPIITFRGVISESTISLVQGALNLASDEPNEAFIEAYIAKIRETLRMMKDGEGQVYPLVNIHLPDNNTENNCLITSFKISRDHKVGNGYYVDITAKKLLIADTAFSVVPATDAHQATVSTSSTSTEVFEDTTLGSLTENKAA